MKNLWIDKLRKSRDATNDLLAFLLAFHNQKKKEKLTRNVSMYRRDREKWVDSVIEEIGVRKEKNKKRVKSVLIRLASSFYITMMGLAMIAISAYAWSVISSSPVVGNISFGIGGSKFKEYALVSTAEGLQEAFNNGYRKIYLSQDLNISSDIILQVDDEDISTIIDLGNNTLNFASGSGLCVYSKEETSEGKMDVTIQNGSIMASSNDYAITVWDDGTETPHLTIHLENLYVSGGVALGTNGMTGGAILDASYCEFIGTSDEAAYLPANNEYWFNECSFRGSSGAYLKSGTYTFNDCAFYGTGSYRDPQYSGNGSLPTGSGLDIDSCSGGYVQNLAILINGGRFESTSGYGFYEFSTSKDGSDLCYASIRVVGDPEFSVSPEIVSGYYLTHQDCLTGLAQNSSESGQQSTGNTGSSESSEPAEGEQSTKGDQPAVEQPAEDQPAEESPADDQPAVEQPVEDQPAVEQPAEDQPTEEPPADDQPAVEQPADDQPAEDQPAVEDQPAAEDQPSVEQPAEDQPTEESPAEEAPVVDESLAEEEQSSDIEVISE